MPFKALNLHPSLVRAATDLGYAEPTPVQAGAIPPALAGRDILATAQTGTGKTAAFLLPLLHRLLTLPRGSTRALVLSPTRELAQQIESVARGLARHSGMRTTLVLGGHAMGPQERALRAGPDLVIATPGRLLDLLNRGAARLDRVTALVLDEADRMLDMGFLPDVQRIVSRLPAREQTLMFSATLPPVIARLAGELLKNPATVQIGRRATAAVGITQAAYPVPAHLKTALLRHLLRETEMPSVLIFTRTKHEAKKLASVVLADGFTVTELHSNRSPSQRARAMTGFRRGEFQVLVATNIAARGLDVEHITHVINMDVPDVPEDYVHRIGRTGRAGAEGDAFILVSPDEDGSLVRIERQVGHRLPRVTLPDFDYRQPAPPRSPAAATPARKPARPAHPPGKKGPHKPVGDGRPVHRGGPPSGEKGKSAGGGRPGGPGAGERPASHRTPPGNPRWSPRGPGGRKPRPGGAR